MPHTAPRSPGWLAASHGVSLIGKTTRQTRPATVRFVSLSHGVKQGVLAYGFNGHVFRLTDVDFELITGLLA